MSVTAEAEIRFSEAREECRFNYAPDAKTASVKFLTPGLVSYKDLPGGGVELLRKETIDEALTSLEGIPLTIDHVDLRQAAQEALSNGRVTAGRFNAEDGWYWCDTTVETKQASSGIRRGLTPSVGYEVLEWGPGGTYQNMRYDREIKKIRFNHMAIVPKPRYNDSVFRLNSITNPDSTMNPFKLIKKIVARVNGTDTTTEETSQVSGESTIEIDGKPVRLNELGKEWMATTKKVVDGNACSGEDEIEIDGTRVKLNSLVEMYKNSRKNADDEEKKKKEAEEEAARKNALATEEQKKAEADKLKADEALKARKNAEGKEAFFKLQQAPINGGEKQTFASDSGSISQQVERGKKRY